MTGKNKILLLGKHPKEGLSMLRYERMAERMWKDLGYEVDVCASESVLGSSNRFGKSGIYIDKFLLALPRVLLRLVIARNVHIVDHSDAIYLNLLPRKRTLIVTCHDLIAVRSALKLGRPPSYALHQTPGGRLYQRLVLRGLRRAGRLWAVSEATARDISSVVGREAWVVPNYLDDTFAERLTLASATYDRDPPYFLSVGTSAPHKNRTTAIEWFAEARTVCGYFNATLVVARETLQARERALVVSLGLQGAVREVGRVDESALLRLYAGAEALLMPSLDEGFGWPIIEAQSQGTPVLGLDSEVFREVAAGGGLPLGDRATKDDVRASFERLRDGRQALSEAAARNSARFSRASVRESWRTAIRADGTW